MRRRRHFLSTDWPFWLLIAAWVCANVPSSATVHAFVWLNGARHFSHYSELRQNVAGLLSGKSTSFHSQFAVTRAPVRSLPPVFPANDHGKKIDLAVTPATPRLIGTQLSADRIDLSLRPPDGPSSDVPYPPPRARGEV